MATDVDHTHGYQCEFIDSVSEDFYCKKCNLVAKNVTICSHCMESYCKTCLSDVKEQGQPCPTCGEENFQAMSQVKYQKRMKKLRVYCSLKEKGCDWSGTLEELDTHLDPNQDNCQYVDTKCPLNCGKTFPRKNIKQHVSEECVKRPFSCQYCSFQATYEDVIDMHLPKCKKVILSCPNKCGEEFEREVIEEHKKTCPLEEIECEFSGMGCNDRFRREDQEEHTRQNSHKHLTLTASLAKQLQQKLEEQQRKYKEETSQRKKTEGERKILERKVEAYEKTIRKQERKIDDLGNLIEDLGIKMDEQQFKMSRLEGKLKKNGQTMEEQKQPSLKSPPEVKKLQPIEKTSPQTPGHHTTKMSRANFEQRVEQAFEIINYSTQTGNTRSSPTMYTHQYGYKFFVQAYVSALNYLCVTLFSVPGEYDSQLQWPARVKFSIKLLHQQGGEDVETSDIPLSWKQPNGESKINTGISIRAVSQLRDYLIVDTLRFCISSTKLL